MIVDGICIQFLGSFDYAQKNAKHSVSVNQQINGTGRVELDAEYYRELSSSQVRVLSRGFFHWIVVCFFV